MCLLLHFDLQFEKMVKNEKLKNRSKYSHINHYLLFCLSQKVMGFRFLMVKIYSIIKLSKE